jgi:hypothetical protein
MAQKRASRGRPAAKRGPGVKSVTTTSLAKGANDPFARKPKARVEEAQEPLLHVYGDGIKCVTDTRGYATPRNADRTRIVVDSSEGFIPLWARNSTLRWRFQPRSMAQFADPSAAMEQLRQLMGEALLAWGDAVPVKFAERRDAWDFEVVVRNADDCDQFGCTLASAFFPDAGRHQLVVYPEMFEQTRREQIETLVHEFGHVFGLRHFFAKIEEQEWSSEIFGRHSPFSIMNYGRNSRLTPADRSDLKKLYKLAWSGALGDINGTRIKFFRPFHYDD